MMIYEPTESEIFHYGGARHIHLYNRQDSSLCGSITRGIGYRNLAGRMAALSSKGEDMQTYTCENGCTNGAEIYAWKNTLGLTKRGILVNLSGTLQKNEVAVLSSNSGGQGSVVGMSTTLDNGYNMSYFSLNNATTDVHFIKPNTKFAFFEMV